MKTFPIPDDEQIHSLLTRTFVQKIGEYVPNPLDTDYMRYFSVTGTKVAAYLEKHPEEAKSYFARWSQVKTTHDVPKIWREGTNYRVAWLDHGMPRDLEDFATLEKAVAAHVTLEFGLPKN
ncbi:MAG TPA: hypothetical protein VN915_10325 [Elusimicrobiota bacterium]|nr:hypothetical protein [Elusimicrobiota bacterium]